MSNHNETKNDKFIEEIQCKHGCHSVSEILNYLQNAPMAKCNGCHAFSYENGLALCKYLL